LIRIVLTFIFLSLQSFSLVCAEKLLAEEWEPAFVHEMYRWSSIKKKSDGIVVLHHDGRICLDDHANPTSHIDPNLDKLRKENRSVSVVFSTNTSINGMLPKVWLDNIFTKAGFNPIDYVQEPRFVNGIILYKIAPNKAVQRRPLSRPR
jgi:hypothetical protein